MPASLLIVTQQSQFPNPQPKATVTEALSEFYSLMPGLWRNVEYDYARNPQETAFADITVTDADGNIVERAVKVIVSVGAPGFPGTAVMVETGRGRTDVWTTGSHMVRHKCAHCEEALSWHHLSKEWFHTDRVEDGQYAVLCEGTTGNTAELLMPL